jgi:hypothetical protein
VTPSIRSPSEQMPITRVRSRFWKRSASICARAPCRPRSRSRRRAGRRRLDAGRQAVLGMARASCCAAGEALQVVERQVEAGEVQQRVEQHRAVPGREHEAVAPAPGGSCADQRSQRVQSTAATSAMPIGMPGWPELAFCTASIARPRIVLATRRSWLGRGGPWGSWGAGGVPPGNLSAGSRVGPRDIVQNFDATRVGGRGSGSGMGIAERRSGIAKRDRERAEKLGERDSSRCAA